MDKGDNSMMGGGHSTFFLDRGVVQRAEYAGLLNGFVPNLFCFVFGVFF